MIDSDFFANDVQCIGLTKEAPVKVAIRHELVYQELQSIFITKSFEGTKMAVVKAAEKSKLVAELSLALCTLIWCTFDGNDLPTRKYTPVDFTKPSFSNETLVTEIISGTLQLL